MRAYFPLPPTISVPGIKEKINGSITFLNCPNNRLKKLFFDDIYTDIVYLGIYLFKNNAWELLNIKKTEPHEFLEINRAQLKVDNEDMVVIVPKKSNQFKLKTSILENPDSLKVDNSIIAQRVSLNFSFLESSTSYQGEYPLNMSCLTNSSFFSFDTMKDSISLNKKNFIILMNISKINKIKEKIEVKIFDPNNKDKFKIIYAYRNSFTIVNIDEYENDLGKLKTIFLVSKYCSFIPIFLSFDLSTKQLSVEHSHPPSEYFFGHKKFELVNLMKKRWVV